MSTWRRGVFPQHVAVRTAWPLLHPLESDAGDFAVLRSPSLMEFKANHQSSLSEEQFTELEKEFRQLYNACVEGDSFSATAWKTWAKSIGIQFNTRHEVADTLNASQCISIDYLSDLSEDYLPGIGLFSDSFIWGPLAEQSLPTPLRQLAGAICSTLPLLQYRHSPCSKVFEQRPKIPQGIHESLSAHCRNPTMLWKIKDGCAYPLLPLGKQYHPTGNVKELPNSKYMIGKIIQIQGQWRAHFVLPLNVINDLQENLLLRCRAEWMRAQRYCSNLHFEDILRERSDIMYRYAAEHCLDNNYTEIRLCLDYYSSPAQAR